MKLISPTKVEMVSEAEDFIEFQHLQYKPQCIATSYPRFHLRCMNDLAVVKVNLPNSLLINHLHQHSLEIDGQPTLQLIGAHGENLHTLLVTDVRMMVFVENGEAIVSMDLVSAVLVFA